MTNYVFENRHRLTKRHYLLLANQAAHWFNASPNVIRHYQTFFRDDFCVVLWRDGQIDDAYVMPFERLKHLFIWENLQGGTGARQRWHGSVQGSQLSLRGTDKVLRVADCFNNFTLLQQ